MSNFNAGSGASTESSSTVAALRAEVQSYKAALAAAQEEAATATAAAAEAQARCDSLAARLAAEADRRSSHSQASARVIQHGSPGRTSPGADLDSGALLQKIRAQRQEMDALRDAFEASNTKRSEAEHERALLSQRLMDSELRERELATATEQLRQQVTSLQHQLEVRQAMLQQLSAAPAGSHMSGMPDSPGSISRSSYAGGHGSEPDGGQGNAGVPSSPRSRASSALHSNLALSPNSKAIAKAQYTSKLDRVIQTWKDACRAKDLRIQELQLDLQTTAVQLDKARADTTSLTSKVLEREQALAALDQQLRLARDSMSAQAHGLESRLNSRQEQLAAAEEALAASQSEVHELRSQLAAARSQLDDVQEEAAVASQQATLYRQQLDSALAQATQLATQLREVTAEQKQAKGDAMQALSQLGPLQEQLARSDAQLGRLVTAVRGLLSAAAAHDSAASLAQVMAAGLFSSHWQQQDQDVVGSHRPSSASGGAGAAPASVAVLSSSCSSISGAARLLEELLGVMGQEMAKRAAVAQEAAREAESLANQLRERDEALQLLTAKLKSSGEAVQGRLDEVARLQAALRRKEADCDAVEAEIQKQIQDYQKLKARLMTQERDSSRFVAEQEALARRCDELTAALTAKQEEANLLALKNAQMEEQVIATRQANQALQDRARALESTADTLTRNHAQAALARQQEAATVDALRSELRAAQQQLAQYKEQLDKRNGEVREAQVMLKAWEAMRLGKDAQIAALMERNKRMEEDSAEKARTVDALRRKIATLTATSVAAAASASTSAGGGPMAGSGSAPGSRTHSYSGYAAPQAVAPSGGVGHAPAPGVPVGVMALGAPAAPPSMRGSVSSVSGGAQHIHVHMHGPSSPGSTAGTAHTTTLQRTVPTTPVARML